MVTPRRGNGVAPTLRRLRRDHPQLADQVDQGKLSANAAAIKAGFRRPTLTVPVDTPDAALAALARRFGKDAILTAADRLKGGGLDA